MRPSHICGFPQNITVARANKGKREIAVARIGAREPSHTGSAADGEEGKRDRRENKVEREKPRRKDTKEGAPPRASLRAGLLCPRSLPLPAASLHPRSRHTPLGSRLPPAVPGTSLNSHVTLPATVLHSMYTPTPNDGARARACGPIAAYTYFTVWYTTHARARIPRNAQKPEFPDPDNARGRAKKQPCRCRLFHVFVRIVTFSHPPLTYLRFLDVFFFQPPLSLYTLQDGQTRSCWVLRSRDGDISRAIMITGHQLFVILAIMPETRVRERTRIFEMISATHSRREVGGKLPKIR